MLQCTLSLWLVHTLLDVSVLWGHCGYRLRYWWRWKDIGLRMATFRSLHWAVLCLESSSQLICSHQWSPESLNKSLPAGIVTSGQPCFKHLSEPMFGATEIFPDVVQCSTSHFELESKVVPICRHIQNLLQHTNKVIQCQFVSWERSKHILVIHFTSNLMHLQLLQEKTWCMYIYIYHCKN